MNIRKHLMMNSERFHGEIHLFFGILAGVVGLFLGGVNFSQMLLIGVVGAFLPDADHLVYLFFYGRKTKYAIEARTLLLKEGFGPYLEYCKKNHKNNTGIISHNMIVPMVAFCLALLMISKNEINWSVFLLSVFGHFVFDMLEDMLFFGKLNGNWYLHYGKKRS